MFLRYVILAVLMLPAFHSTAQAQSGEPLEITADESMEWHRNKFYFRANKNVIATQGGTTIKSDRMTARYDGKKKSIDIHTLEANGSVRILSGQSTAYGSKVVYDVRKGYAVMTGGSLKIVSKNQTVTAQQKFQYWVNKGRLEAVGDAVAVQQGDKLEANKIVAIFREDASGKRDLKELEAIGNVVITTPDEVLTGSRATYNADSNLAQLLDDVKITRGPNVLEGSRAEVNLATNVSKIFGGVVTEDGDTGRVRGVFYPGSDGGLAPQDQGDAP